jgi:hypothetical protein
MAVSECGNGIFFSCLQFNSFPEHCMGMRICFSHTDISKKSLIIRDLGEGPKPHRGGIFAGAGLSGCCCKHAAPMGPDGASPKPVIIRKILTELKIAI